MKLVLAALLLLYPFYIQSKTFENGNDNLKEERILYGGYGRSYYLHLPSVYDPKEKYPLVIFLHGFGGNGKNGLEQGHWIEKSDKEHFIVAGLNGVLKHPGRRESFLFNPRSWNCGGEGTPSEVKGINDVGFIDTVITILESKYSVDKNRIYIAGFSNGAAMTFRAGMELSDKVAAIAPVSSVLLVKPHPLKMPVSLILIYGTDDPINPFNGGKVKRFGEEEERISAEKMWELWGDLLKCPDEQKTIYSNNGVTGKRIGPDSAGAESDFYTVEGMGHSWPGGTNLLPKYLVGKSSNKINATDLIWNFFMEHSKAN